ncbi:hypothetical protein QFC21_006925 [Naganishia friedmannii]|uniref:Uncharacterized protein n=1 Tax=Naganishia friedmannii TaxID=89922 RepID=A0ACC2UZM8_9TREE|nr:hypothetical protein QFC21_006925 [Naganishia friedmannii]
MSQVPAPKKVLAHRIDESTAANYDLLVTYASSIPKDRLLPLEEWLRRDCPSGNYQGAKPTYHLKFDWNADDCPVEVINRAMERCFDTRGLGGWEVWIRGDQLILLVGDFRKEYRRLKASGNPQFSLLDLWVGGLLDELKRIYELPVSIEPAKASSLLDPASTETQHRRSSRSPSRPIDSTLYPRVLPTEINRRLSKSPSPKPPPMSPAIPSDQAPPSKRLTPSLSAEAKGKETTNTSSSSRPPPSRPKAVQRNASTSDATIPAESQPRTLSIFALPSHVSLTKPYAMPLKNLHLDTSHQRDGTLKGKSRIPPGYAMAEPSEHESDGVLETDIEGQEIDWADSHSQEEEEDDDEEQDTDEEDDDDEEVDEYQPEQTTKKSKKKNKSADPVIDLSSGESAPDNAPIFLEHDEGPARKRQAKSAAAKKAKARPSSSFQTALQQLRSSSADSQVLGRKSSPPATAVHTGPKRKAPTTLVATASNIEADPPHPRDQP